MFLLGVSGMAYAETIQDLSRNNASPEEIIQKLSEPKIVYTPNIETKEPVQVGRLISLIRKDPETPFYDFTIALSDDQVVTVSDANHLNLKPGDTVILTGSRDFWQIKSKLPK